jgi:ABC-type spermidine/putrescine transport system permease subunit I
VSSTDVAARQRPIVVAPDAGAARYPRWFWPSFAAPGIAYLLVLFVLPFYVILSVAFGRLDPIFQSPVLVWNPLAWDTSILSFTVSNITHTDGIYHAAFIRTFAYVAASMVLCLLIGYPFAYFLARHAGRAKGLFLALFFAPFWFSYMLRMLAWIGLLQDQGYVNRLLVDAGVIGAPYPFLSGKSWVLVLGLVYGYVPYMVLPLYAGLDRIPNAHLEAARDLGASPARTFFRVTLPQTWQAILAGLIIAGLPMFGDYFTQQLLANTVGTKMIGNFIVDSLDVPIFVNRGASLILVLMALLTVPIVYYLWSTGRAARARAA